MVATQHHSWGGKHTTQPLVWPAVHTHPNPRECCWKDGFYPHRTGIRGLEKLWKHISLL